MIAGIDLDTRAVHIVLLDDDSADATRHEYEIADKRGSFYAACNVQVALPSRSWWEDNGVWLVGIEKPMSPHARSVSALMRIQGAILSRIPYGICKLETQPNEWKRETVGLPNATKEQVAEWATSGARTGWPQDALDAYAIAHAVRSLNERGIRAASAA